LFAFGAQRYNLNCNLEKTKLNTFCTAALATLLALILGTPANASLAPTRSQSQKIASPTYCTLQWAGEEEEAAGPLAGSRLSTDLCSILDER
jgi:hypothetical protein